jgi:UDP-GlcNAc:undecaprenyl-phosphate GlcNAc-1-phosphate transferase
VSLALSLAVATSACAVAWATIPVFRWVAVERGWLDVAGADPLKIHAAPTPFVGGLGIVLGCTVALGVFTAVTRAPDVPFVLATACGVAALGFRDDVAATPPVARLAVELIAGLCLAAGGLAVGLFQAAGSHVGAALGIVVLGAFYVVGGVNAVNMQDGIDGLAGGIVLISCAGYAWLGIVTGRDAVLAVALALGGALVGFLVHNLPPASVFMGDNGSYFLGFLTATLALILTVEGGTLRHALGGALMVGVPVFDAALAVGRRLSRGVSPVRGDRSHFYDYLAMRGLPIPVVTAIGWVVQLISVGAGLTLLVD